MINEVYSKIFPNRLTRLDLGSAIHYLGDDETEYVEPEIIGNVNGISIVREESVKGPQHKVLYSLNVNEEEYTNIFGYLRSEAHFRIDELHIENLGYGYAIILYEAIEKDLKSRGVTTVSTIAVDQIARYMKRRLGFVETNNFMDFFRRGEMFGLEKIIQ